MRLLSSLYLIYFIAITTTGDFFVAFNVKKFLPSLIFAMLFGRCLFIPLSRAIVARSNLRALSTFEFEEKHKHLAGLYSSQHESYLPDVNNQGLKAIGESTGIQNLSPATFSPHPFPINGFIFGLNNRLMVSLVCQCQFEDMVDLPIINVWFVVDTTSNYTFLAPNTIKTLTNNMDPLPICLPVALQDKTKTPTPCHISYGNFAESNIIGMMSLFRMKVTITEISRKMGTFKLEKCE